MTLYILRPINLIQSLLLFVKNLKLLILAIGLTLPVAAMITEYTKQESENAC
jgi:hypothetical protein